jgi:hypothetical protein
VSKYVEVRFEEPVVGIVERIAEKKGCESVDVIRKALSLYAWMFERQSAGAAFKMHCQDGSTARIVLP